MTAQEWLEDYDYINGGGDRMTIKEIKFKWDGQGKALSAAEIDFLLSEITRLRAELREREEDVERLRDMIADSHDELLQKFDSNAVGHTDLYTWIKCILEKIERLKSLAASRLADQERIERHTEKRVAGEILDIVGHCESFADLRSVIWQKYGVE